jgi:hypothetical protein
MEEVMSRLQSLTEELRALNAYTRLPSRLEVMHPDISAMQKADKYGTADRLKAITTILASHALGEAADLGAIRVISV